MATHRTLEEREALIALSLLALAAGKGDEYRAALVNAGIIVEEGLA